MYSGLKSLSQKDIECRSNNIKLSGGLPHSEIRGSKPILGSPQLIAEYHVLHRLLLPRHPPNALLALDLIQKTTGPLQPDLPIKSILSRSPSWFVKGNMFAILADRLVSVLDLD